MNKLDKSDKPGSSISMPTYDINKPKAGVKTSEFWVVLANNVVGVLVMLGYLSPDQATEFTQALMSVIGGLVVMVSTIVYIVSRIKLKQNSPQNSTPESILPVKYGPNQAVDMPELLPSR